jgi:TonB family protein
MNTSTRLALLGAVAVLAAPLALLGAENEGLVAQLGLTSYAEPAFPDTARLDGFATGHVTVALSRNAQGETVDILVLSATHPQMADNAVNAVRQWRFSPSNNPADLAPHVVRIDFRTHGVVVFPYGKNPVEERDIGKPATKLSETAKVPSFQSLAQQPKALVQPMPAYPASLVSRKIEGTAAVRFYVDEDGRVRLPELIEATTPEFAEAALAAVAQWRFEPPQVGGRTIIASSNWQFQFKANN